MKVALKCVKKADSFIPIQAGRTGTVFMTKDDLEREFGSPQWSYDEERDGSEDKIKYIYVFDTPRGAVHVRDYWWNGPDEQSISASNSKANLWIKSYLKNLGYKVA